MGDFVYTNKQTLKNCNFSGENLLSLKVLRVFKFPTQKFWGRWLRIRGQISKMQDGVSNMANSKLKNDANFMKTFLEDLGIAD